MKYSSAEDFVVHQLELLKLERNAEIAESQKLLETVSSKKLEEKGVCLMNLVINHIHSGLYGRTVVAFTSKVVGKELPATSLSNGDIVGIFSSSSASHKDQLCTGIINCSKASLIEVAIDLDAENINLDDTDCYKIIKLANNVTYKRLKEGLQELKGYHGPANILISVLFGGSQFSPPLTSLPPNLINSDGSLVWFNSQLDNSQKIGVEFALKQKEIAIIHGPPGTGKTTTVVESILQMVKAGNRVLVCAPSNCAVDNVLEKLVKYSPIKAVRLGHPTRMQESIQNRSLDAILSNSDATSIVNDVRKELDGQLKLISKSKKRGQLFSEIKNLRKELRERETKAIKEVLSHADVILTTLTSATRDGPLKHVGSEHFDVVVIDECSQATEVSCWLALTWAPKALIAGDHWQLAPTILSTDAAQRGLGLTLMERILKSLDGGKSCIHMLTTQYRMNKDIMQWSSNLFYEGKLIAHPSVEDHLLLSLRSDVEENENTSIPLLLIDTTGMGFDEAFTTEEGSKANPGEAQIVAIHVESLVSAGIRMQEIAIISPYNLQVEMLRNMLVAKYPEIEIKSVDGFQGREKEAVIVSLVRSNSVGQVGFVKDTRRLNVACTRARRHLCLITDSSTTSRATNGLIEYIEQNGEVRSAHQYLGEIEKISIGSHKPFITNVPKAKKLEKPVENVSSIDDKKEIAERIVAVLKKWSQDSSSCEATKEFPTTLTAFERSVVHNWAEENGYHHLSIGEKENRRIIVTTKYVTHAQSEIDRSEVTKDSSHNIEELLQPNLKDKIENEPEVTVEQNLISEIKNVRISKGQSKKKANPKTLEQKKLIGSGQKIGDSTELNSDDVKCDTCQKIVPRSNLTLHKLRCSEVASAVKPKQKQPLLKSLPKVDVKKRKEDIDAVLDDFHQLDNICNLRSCKASVTIFGQLCSLCRRIFCISHHLPEVHGCGDAARDHARSFTRKQGFVSSGSQPYKEKSLDPNKRAHLQRSLESKIEAEKTKRVGSKEDKKKKK